MILCSLHLYPGAQYIKHLYSGARYTNDIELISTYAMILTIKEVE